MRKSEVSDEWLAAPFKDHVVTDHILWDPRKLKGFEFAAGAKQTARYTTLATPMERLVWQKEGDSSYYVAYHRTGTTLLVIGDLGEAVYRWHPAQPIDLRWISNCNLDYFKEKCCASEVGSKFEEWDSGAAKKYFEEMMRTPVEDDSDEAEQTFEKTMEEFAALHGPEAFEYEMSWHMWLANNGDFLRQYDYDWCEWAYDIGMVTHARCRLHLLGLKMAFGLKFPKKEEADAQPQTT